MPRKRKSVPIRRSYSRDLKRRVIYQAEILGLSSTEISISLDMPLRCVQRVRRNWREIGEVCMDRTYIGRAPLMSSAAVEVSLLALPAIRRKLTATMDCACQFMLALLEHSPDLYLDELQDQLQVQHDIDVSLATIGRTLKRLGIGSKKVRCRFFIVNIPTE